MDVSSLIILLTFADCLIQLKYQNGLKIRNLFSNNTVLFDYLAERSNFTSPLLSIKQINLLEGAVLITTQIFNAAN